MVEILGPEGADHWFWRYHEAGQEPVLFDGPSVLP